MMKNVALGLMILGGVLLIGGIIVSLVTKTVKPIYIIAIASSVGALIVITGAIATLFKELSSSEKTDSIRITGEKTNTEVQALTVENKKLQNTAESSQKLIKAQGSVIDAQGQTIVRLEEQNSKLSARADEIHAQTAEIKSNITGGDSWCYVRLIKRSDHLLGVQLYPVGDYQLTNLKIKITHSSAIGREVKGEGSYYKKLFHGGKYTTEFTVNTLSKQRDLYDIQELGTVPFQNGINEDYELTFSTQDKEWRQYYKLEYEKNGNFYKDDYRVERAGVILLDHKY